MKNALFYRLVKEVGTIPKGIITIEGLLPVLVLFHSTGAASVKPELAGSDIILSWACGRYISVGIEWLSQNLTDEEMVELVVFRLQGKLSQDKSLGDHKIYPEGWSHYSGPYHNQRGFSVNYVPLLYIKPVDTIGMISCCA